MFSTSQLPFKHPCSKQGCRDREAADQMTLASGVKILQSPIVLTPTQITGASKRSFHCQLRSHRAKHKTFIEMSIPTTTLLCPTCLQALQPAQAIGYYDDPRPGGQSLEMFRKAAAGSCLICSSLHKIEEIPPHAWRDIDEDSWNPLHFQIEREDADGKLATFTIYVGYHYPSDDNEWDFSHSTYKLVRLDGMVLLILLLLPSNPPVVAHSYL